ncbi:unnamed protein product [Symbiodinium sp. KB8]|nr:unnamed protein product [Symbiodinium sp. KB8]
MAAESGSPGLKALILVGGFGTRLRPLTFTKPKPLVEFANLAIVLHQIEALAQVGVTEVVLAIGFKPEAINARVPEIEKKYGVKVTVSLEETPMGTAGPLALAREHLKTPTDEPFFVFNSDVTCEYPLADLLAFHKAHGKEGTIMVTQVKDPSKYGVVVYGEDGRIERFVEKPTQWVGDRINAGLYIFSPSILARIPDAPTSIEREVFPVMAGEGNLFAMDLPGYWMDIGQPKDYLTGSVMHLASLAKRAPHRLATGEGIKGNVLVHESATIGAGSVVGPDVIIGEGVVVGAGVRLQRCTLLQGAIVKDHAFVKDSIIGWNSTLGAWTRVEGSSVLGEDVQLAEGQTLNGTIVLPHKGVKDSWREPGKIIM